MFHMMNEARIGVGMGAVMLGLAGYEASLEYARQRPQGRRSPARGQTLARTRRKRRSRSSNTPTSSACCWRRRRMSKAASRSSFIARVSSTNSTPAPKGSARGGAAARDADAGGQELAKRMVPGANSLAIQIHGGYGYTRDFMVEQYWRDNRLNMIHEGTHGIQALDLLGRKVMMDGGRGPQAAGFQSERHDRTRRSHAGLGRAGERARRRAAEGGRRRKSAWATAWPKRRWPTRRRSCRLSATSSSLGCGSTWRSPPSAPPPHSNRQARRQARRDALLLRLRNCRRSTPGWRSSPAALTSAARCTRIGFEVSKSAVDAWVWTLIYGGLLASSLGLFARAQPAGAGLDFRGRRWLSWPPPVSC